MLTEPKEMINE